MKRFLGIIFLSLVLFFCEDKVSVNKLKSDIQLDTSKADNIIKTSRIQLIKDNRVTAIIYAKVIKNFEKNLIFADSGLKIYFLNSENDTVSTLTSEKGFIYPTSNNMEASGNVIVNNGDSLFLYTNKLLWDNKKEKIYTNDTVTIVRKDGFLKGVGFEANANLTEYKFKKVYAKTNKKRDR